MRWGRQILLLSLILLILVLKGHFPWTGGGWQASVGGRSIFFCARRRLQRPNNKGFVSKNNDPGEIVKEQNDVQNNHQVTNESKQRTCKQAPNSWQQKTQSSGVRESAECVHGHPAERNLGLSWSSSVHCSRVCCGESSSRVCEKRKLPASSSLVDLKRHFYVLQPISLFSLPTSWSAGFIPSFSFVSALQQGGHVPGISCASLLRAG